MREIGETGSDGSGLNTTIIKYGDAVATPFEVETSSIVQGSGHDFYSGDYDGDGDSEILTSAYSYTEDGFRYNSNLEVYRRTGPNNLQLSWSIGLDPEIQAVNEQNVPQTYTANVSNDMNGDGRDDIVLGKVHNDGTHYRLQNFTVLESNSGDASSFATNTFNPPNYAGEWFDVVYPSTFNYQVAGDFNGDGKGDILAILSNENYYHGFLYSPWGGYTGAIMGITNGAGDLAKSSYLAAIDFDGDGAHEILSVWGDNSAQQNTRIYRWTTTPVQGFEIIWSSSGFPTAGHKLYPGDFNGDGKTDLLNRYGDLGPWNIAYSTGSDFYGLPFSQFNTPVNLGYTPDILTVADFNGDGKSDICHGRNIGGNSSVLDLFYSRGTLQDFKERSFNNTNRLGWSPALITDLNGDGRSEVINTTDIFSPIEIYFFDRSGHERSVQKIVNGMGAINQFGYGYMTEPAVHTRGTNFAYPVGDAQLPLELVKESSATNGLGGMNGAAHAYGTATLKRTGRGFVGFKQVYTSDPVTNRTTVNQYGVQPDYAELFPESSQLYRSDVPGSLISNTAHTVAFVPLGTPALRRHLIRDVSTIAYDALAATTSSTANTAWNNVGLVTSSIRNVNGIEITSTTTTYVSAGPSTQQVKPQEVSVTSTRASQPAVTKSTSFQYSSSTGALEISTAFSGTSGMVTTTFEYYAAGNVRSRTTWYPLLNASQRPVERFRYDPKYRFVHEATRVWNDAGNFINVTTYIATDARWGLPIDTYSSDGLTTLKNYDPFGRLVRIDVPHIAGSPRYSVDLEREWAVNGSGEVAVLRTTDPAGPDQEVYSDILGRPVRTQRESFGHETVITTSGYDLRGNVAWETTPHKDTESFLTLEHQFDPYNRIVQDANPLTGSVEYQYDYSGGNLNVTVTNAASGQSSTITTDATGKKVRSTDNGGELKYTYDSWGNVTRTYHDGYMVLRNTYDEYGRQTELWAPNAGTTKYKCNPFGQLVWQKNANGHEVTLSYDNLGRTIKRVAPEGGTSWTYFNNGGRINNNLASVIGPTVQRVYGYTDPYNRLKKVSSTIDGQVYTMEYAYDAYDHVTRQTYPSSLQIDSEYDTDGSLARVAWGGTTLFEASVMNGLGQYTAYTMGDGSTLSKEYEHGFLRSVQGGTMQDLHMEYDYSTGNMISRWDRNKFVRESLEYDDLNRLIGSTVEAVDAGGNPTGFGFAPTEYAYDGSIGSSRGNLILRSDIGQLGYGSNAVMAAKHLSYPTPYNQPPFEISQETQQITYTPFLKTDRITETVGVDAYELAYEYGPEYSRTRSVQKRNGNVEVTRVYLGGYEKQTTPGHVDLIHYINGGDGPCAMLVNSDGVWNAYSVYKDHLGSIVGVTDVSDGSPVAEQNFDPWGRHRKPTTWAPSYTPSLPRWLYRGFTGHEHADPFTLINMDGRMYDPNTGRMLVTDNYVNGSSETQSYNRYTYAANNPLKYSDPSGDFVQLIAAGVIGGAINWMTHGGRLDAKGLGYFGIGAVASAIGFGAGQAISAGLGTSAGFINGAIAGGGAGAAGGAVLGSGNALVGGQNSSGIMDAGWRGALTGAATGGLIGGISGGIYAARRGGDFWNAKGMTQAMPASIQMEGTSGSVDYSNQFAQEFSSRFLKAPNGLRSLYADGSVPSGWTLQSDVAMDAKGEVAQGVTEYMGKGLSDVFLFPRAFTSHEQLYLVMQHEYMHVGFYANGLMSYNKQEAGAREWMLAQGKAWGYKVDVLQQVFDQTQQFLSPKYNYGNLGINILNTPPW